MNQLTIRGFGPDLAKRIQDLAEREGLSLNQAALRLLRKGAGLARNDQHDDEALIGSSLDHFFGTWSDANVHAMEKATREFEQIDDSLWR